MEWEGKLIMWDPASVQGKNYSLFWERGIIVGITEPLIEPAHAFPYRWLGKHYRLVCKHFLIYLSVC